MKNLTIIVTLLIVTLLFLGCHKSSVNKSQMVNPLLGDISFESKFGHKPDARTDNNLRIRTHLEYVEHLLRNKDVSGLSPELQANRNHLLNLLHDYRTTGLFPKNYDYANQRKPCFIDKDGNICAVGYLLEQTTSREIAKNVSSKYKYDELLSMNDQSIDNWISSSGLTKDECAMIQPTYGHPSNNYIDPNYGVSTAVLGGFSLALNTINGIHISNGTNNNIIPVLGGLTGATQIILGALTFQNENIEDVNESQKTLSMINIGLGTTTLILSLWSSALSEKPESKLTTWNIQTFPEFNKQTGIALCMTRRF